MSLGYRPIRLKTGWTKKASLNQLIKEVENYLFQFAKSETYDSGHRLSETEAYLQGLYDAKKLSRKSRG